MAPALTLSPHCDLGQAPSLSGPPSPQPRGKEFHQSVPELSPSSDILGFQNLFPSWARDLVAKDSEKRAVVWNPWVGRVGHVLINLTGG